MFKSLSLSIALLFSCALSFGQHIISTEMLHRPENTSISIEAIFDTVVQARVYYGTASGVYTNQTSWQIFNTDTTGEAVVIIVLANLTQDTKYYYKLQYGKPGDTAVVNRPEHSFHTARPAGQSFTFVIQADPHMDANSDSALYRLCLQNQSDDNPDLMIDLGDFIMTDKLKNVHNVVPEDTVPYRCKLLRSFYESINHSIPLFNVMGDHEGEEGWYINGTPNNVAVWDTKYRKKYFMNPLPDSFYGGDTTHYNYVRAAGSILFMAMGQCIVHCIQPLLEY